MITRKQFPAPIKLTNNGVLFPLDDLTALATKKGWPALAAEFERLAFARAVDLRPESVEKTLAKRLSQQYGERFTPHQVAYGAFKQATDEEAHAVRVAQFMQVVESMRAR
jgi:hypothetical protein